MHNRMLDEQNVDVAVSIVIYFSTTAFPFYVVLDKEMSWFQMCIYHFALQFL